MQKNNTSRGWIKERAHLCVICLLGRNLTLHPSHNPCLQRLSWFKDLEYVINIQTTLYASQNMRAPWKQPDIPIQWNHSQSSCYNLLSTVATPKALTVQKTAYRQWVTVFAWRVAGKNDEVSVRVAWSRFNKYTVWWTKMLSLAKSMLCCTKIRQAALCFL